MLTQSIMPTHRFRVVLVASFVLACFTWAGPGRGMPINVHAVLWWSIPLASLWALTVGVSAYRFGRKSLWMLFAAPLALYCSRPETALHICTTVWKPAGSRPGSKRWASTNRGCAGTH